MATLNVPALSREEKIEEAIQRSIAFMPGDVGAQFKALLTPQSLAIMVATLVGLVVAQAFGVGELADALLLIAAIGFCGWGAAEGCRDLYHFVRQPSRHVRAGPGPGRTVLCQCRGQNRYQRADGLSAQKTAQILSPGRWLRGLNYRPSLERVGPPPAPGTRPTVQFRPLARSLGETDEYGNIVIDSRLSPGESKLTLDHEMVHRFFSPRFGPFLQLRARVAISGYMRSALLRYLEEAMAESYAQVRAQGFRGVIEGVRFPLKGNNPYISIQERAAIRGQFLGTIVVDGQVMTVSLEYGPAQATSPQQNRQETTGAPAR